MLAGQPVNLDEAQDLADSMFGWAESCGYERQANFAAMTKVLVTELRAAREVIDKARQHNDCSVCAKAIAAYDKLAGEAPQ